jgi:hypothetical protein
MEGVVSTTGDLLKFMKALVHNQILKKETIEKEKRLGEVLFRHYCKAIGEYIGKARSFFFLVGKR